MNLKHTNAIADILHKEAVKRMNLHQINERALLEDIVVSLCVYFLRESQIFDPYDFMYRVWESELYDN